MWPNPQFLANLVIFTEEILNGKLLFCPVQIKNDEISYKTINSRAGLKYILTEPAVVSLTNGSIHRFMLIQMLEYYFQTRDNCYPCNILLYRLVALLIYYSFKMLSLRWIQFDWWIKITRPNVFQWIKCIKEFQDDRFPKKHQWFVNHSWMSSKITIDKSNHRRCSIKRDFLKTFAIFK